MVAAGKGRLDVLSVLLSNGADPLLAAKNGMTARDWAAHFGFEDIVEVRLQGSTVSSCHAQAMQSERSTTRDGARHATRTT